MYRKQKFPLKARIPINVLKPKKFQNNGVSKMNNYRCYNNEKSRMRRCLWGSWIFGLSAVTGVLYIIVFFYLKSNPNLNVYYFLILGGIVGGFWGVGIDEAYSFSMWARYGNDFQKRYDWVNENKSIDHWIQAYPTEESFLANLRWLKRNRFWSFVFLAIVLFVIIFFNVY